MRRYQEVSISAGRVRTTHLGKACAMRTLRLLLIASNENEQPRRKRRGIKTKDHCKSVRPKGRGIDPLPAYSHGMMQGQEPPCVSILVRPSIWPTSTCPPLQFCWLHSSGQLPALAAPKYGCVGLRAAMLLPRRRRRLCVDQFRIPCRYYAFIMDCARARRPVRLCRARISPRRFKSTAFCSRNMATRR